MSDAIKQVDVKIVGAKKVGVIGAGTMGIGICEVAASFGQQVRLFDLDTEMAKKAVDATQARLKKRVIRGKITQAQADGIIELIQVVDDMAHFNDCDLVVEAIVENLAIKQDVFQKLEVITKESALLASNTSSLSITAIAATMKQPERLFGLHFFNPAPVMKLVEVIAGLKTDELHIQRAVHQCKAWQKIPVVASSTPGFIVNRVARSYYGEPMKMYQEQLASHYHMDAVMTEAAGFRMGPFTLMDLIGIDINYAVSQSVYNAMYQDPRFKPSLIQAEMVNANTLGKKTNQGFYSHQEGAVKPKAEYIHSDAQFDGIVVPENETYFSAMFGDFECDDRKWQGDKVVVSGCQILLTDGRLAKDIEADSDMPTCLVDLSFDYKKSTAVNVSFSPKVDPFMRNRIVALFNQMDKQVLMTEDQPGLIAMRTIAMLINEAAEAVFNGVCSAKDVDLAMQYGVNYPKGLLVLAEQLGWQHIVDTLAHLQQWFGDDRYRLSPYIRNQL